MSDPMWSGGPEQFQDRYPDAWSTFPQFMRDPLLPADPPMSPVAMSTSCLVLMAVPVIGMGAAQALGSYQAYYGDFYRASPPGTHTDTPDVATIPADFVPVSGLDNDVWDYVKVQNSRMYQFVNEWETFKAQWEWFYTHAEYNGDDVPIPAATNVDTARILAGIYYTNWLWYNNPPPIDDTDIINQIVSSANAVIGAVETEHASTRSSVNGNTDQESTVIQAAIAALNNLSSAAVEALLQAAVVTLTGEIGEGTAAVLAGVEALLADAASDARFPGLAEVTLGTPVAVTSAQVVTAAMDGCLLTIVEMPGGTGRHEVGSFTSYQHGGWLCFIGADGYADDLQWINLNQAAYIPKRVKAGTAVLVFPRAGAEVTITPYTLSA